MLNIKDKFISSVVNSPKACLLISLLFIAATIPGLLKLEADFNYKIWFNSDDPNLAQFHEFQERFGNDELILVSIAHEKSLLSPHSIEIIRKLTDELWNIEGVIDVESLSNYQHITHEGEGEILIEDLFPIDGPITEKIVKDRSMAIEQSASIKGYLINHKKNMTLLYARQRPYFNDLPNEALIVEQTRKIVNSFKQKYPQYQFHIGGGIFVGNAYKEVAERDLSTLLPIMFLLIALLLFFLLKSAVAVAIPFVITGVSVLSSFAIAGYLGTTFNNILGIIPQALMAISIADSIHIIVNYLQFKKAGLSQKDSLARSLHKNFGPTLLTTASTSIGFLSFTTAELKPLVDFGYLCAAGTGIAWLATFVLCPALFILLDRKTKPKTSLNEKNTLNIPPMLSSYVAWLHKHRVLLVCLVAVLTPAGIYLSLSNEVNSNPVTYFRKDVPARIANDQILAGLGGLPGPEIVVDSQEESGVYDPSFLTKVDQFALWLEEQQEVLKVNSALSILKEINQIIHYGQKSQYSLPAQREINAEYLFLYQMGLPSNKSLNDKISLDNRYMRLNVLWNLQNSKESMIFIKSIEEQAKKIGLSIKVTGKAPLFVSLNGKVSLSLINSLGLAMILITILFLFIFRSIKISLVSLIPNLLPLIIGAAAMSLLSIKVSFASAMVFSVCLGIVVDDTIHFLLQFKNYLREKKNTKQAIEAVLYTSGTSIFITTILLAIGFGLFAFAQFVLNVDFGIIAAVIFISALIADLIFLPALLLLMEPNHDS